LGIRLREETEFRPKPLVDIGGRPILWHIMKLYAHHGFRDFVLCLGNHCVLEHAPLERLAAEGQLMAYNHDGFFQAMDTYREYRILNDLWKSGEAPWKKWA
jgi:NDP-sugar pyrophosphorylase family protein